MKSKGMWNGTLYYDDKRVQYVLDYHSSSTYSVTSTWTDSSAFDTVPSNLRPAQHVYSHTGDTRLVVRVNSSTGKIQHVNSAQISSPYFQCVLTWDLI